MALDATLYTATATATGGRAGTAATDDGRLSVTLSTPKGLGGDDGPGTNPEQMFAAGYSACFLGAMKFIAGTQKLALPRDTRIDGSVGIGKVWASGTGGVVEVAALRGLGQVDQAALDVLGGGDGYAALGGGRILTNVGEGKLVANDVMAYIEAKGGANVGVEGRIKKLGE